MELVSGRGEVLDPPPGRDLLIPPRTTFDELAQAIDRFLGRWDLAHQRMFRLPDGTTVCSPQLIMELESSPFTGHPHLPLSTSLGRRVKRGEPFSYTFDLGDDWEHRCEVIGTMDPEAEFGQRPLEIVPIWGWGSLPDQYGRRWAADQGDPDDIPPTRDEWCLETPPPAHVDGTAVRAARHAPDDSALHEATASVVIDEALQAIGGAILALAVQGKTGDGIFTLMGRVVNALDIRGWEGDEELRDVLVMILDGKGAPTLLPVDLEELLIAASGWGGEGREGAYLNVQSGETVAPVLTDAAMVGEDAVVDVEGTEWTWVERPSSTREDWQDMEDFSRAEGIAPDLADRMRRAIEGKGAFRRFGDVVHEHESVLARWLTYRDDRRLGRARALLAAQDITVVG